jgi:hypothetical protein
MRQRGWFAGEELSRLILLALVGLAGGLFIWTQYERQRDGAERAREVKPAAGFPDQGPLPPAEEAAEFAVIQDREPIRFAETVAYAELVARARRVSAEELRKISRRDVFFRQVVERPQRYRGLPLHFEGTALQVARLDDIPVTISPSGLLYEAWVVTQDSQGYPSCVLFEELPRGLTVAERMQEPVQFDGYFFKLMAYEGGKTGGGSVRRFAPVYIGRIAAAREAADGGRAGQGPAAAPGGWWNRLDWRIAVLVGVLAYLSVRWLGWLQRQFQPRRDASRRRMPRDVISPEELQAWIREREQAPTRDENELDLDE